MMQTKRIAILGGTFNPIHFGHLLIAQSVYLTKQFHEIWLMPAGNPPFKPDDKANNEDRLYMSYLAVKKVPYIKVSTLECDRPEPSYTYKTLELLENKYPEYEFWWIIGYDNLFSIETWKESERLLTNGKFVIVKRVVEEIVMAKSKLLELQERYGMKAILVDNPIIQISSTMIRERIKNGEPIDFLLPRRVASYIQKQGLYNYHKITVSGKTENYAVLNLKIRKDLKKVLTPSRYMHTLGVEAMAIELGERYKINTERLAIAALLHDYAKCMSAETKRKFCRKYEIEISPIEEKNLDLLHAKLGAYIAQDKYGIDDYEILDAIYYHTTGKPEMTDFAKIIYIADAIEPGRGNMDYLENARKLAKESLDAAMKYLLEEGLKFLIFREREIDPLTQEAYEYYKSYQSHV
ncbi:nicotinate (nicotinamide) nucleotide adenylyltransferase [Clostridiales bacterium COT073_COT-073]|nr:nicotinate (nicotinamide) nucleotide adenylyltransferase [Clostridiales bacterium COT073_COT-073]